MVQRFFLLPPFHAKGFSFFIPSLLILPRIAHTHPHIEITSQYVESDKIQQLCFTILLQADIPANHTRICIPQKASSGLTKTAMFHYCECGWLLSQQLLISWYFSKLAQYLRAPSKHHLMSRIRPHVYNTFPCVSSHCSLHLHIFANPSLASDTCCVNILTSYKRLPF